MVNDSTQKPPAENPPPAQALTISLTPIGNLSPISESVNTQTYNTIIEPYLSEQNYTPVVMDTTNSINLIGKNFPYVIIPDHKIQPKLKAQTGSVRNSVVLCPILYIYHDEVRKYDLIQ